MDRRAFFRHPYSPLTWVGYFFAIAGLLTTIGTVYWLFNEEYGHKDPWFDREVYLLLFGAIFVMIVAAVGPVFRLIYGTSPYREGLYIFATAFVHAPQGFLNIVPIDKVGRPTIVNRYRNGVYQGSWLQLHDVAEPKKIYTLPFRSQTEAEQAVGRLDEARHTYSRMASMRDMQQLEMLDPFYECTIAGQWENPANASVPGPIAKVIPTYAHLARWLGALLLAAIGTAATYSVILSECESNPTSDPMHSNGCYMHGQGYVPTYRPYTGGYRSPYGTGNYRAY